MLTRLFENAIEFLLLVLRKKKNRQKLEEKYLRSLDSAGFSGQERLFNIDKGTVLGMTMSQLYTLILLSPVTCMAFQNHLLSETIEKYTRGMQRALRLVVSISEITAAIWTPRKCGFSVSKVQQIVRLYLKITDDTCSWNAVEFSEKLVIDQSDDETVVPRISNLRNTVDENQETSNDSNDEEATIPNVQERTRGLLDKPNVHRLADYAFFVLPLIGHASVTQELSFEKTHAVMKESVQSSNGHKPRFLRYKMHVSMIGKRD